MDVTNAATQRSITIRADNLVHRPDGCLFVEAMFSGLVDLTAPSVNVAARLHPAKAQAFEWIVTGHCRSVAPEGTPTAVIPDVEIHVNGPGGIAVRHFSEFLDRHRELQERGASDDVRATVTLGGFDPGAEPVVREMRDGSLLLIFAFIPPLVSEREPARATRFDLDTFGTEIEKGAGVPVIWDDRELFVIPHPRGDTVERIRQFLVNYWAEG
jgi:hypothetical protein